MGAAETVPMSKETGSSTVLRGTHTMHSCNGWVYHKLSSAASYFLQCTLKRGKEKRTQEISHRAQQTPSFRNELNINGYSRRILWLRNKKKYKETQIQYKETPNLDSIASLLAGTNTIYMPESNSPKWCFPSWVLIFPLRLHPTPITSQ